MELTNNLYFFDVPNSRSKIMIDRAAGVKLIEEASSVDGRPEALSSHEETLLVQSLWNADFDPEKAASSLRNAGANVRKFAQEWATTVSKYLGRPCTVIITDSDFDHFPATLPGKSQIRVPLSFLLTEKLPYYVAHETLHLRHGIRQGEIRFGDFIDETRKKAAASMPNNALIGLVSRLKESGSFELFRNICEDIFVDNILFSKQPEMRALAFSDRISPQGEKSFRKRDGGPDIFIKFCSYLHFSYQNGALKVPEGKTRSDKILKEIFIKNRTEILIAFRTLDRDKIYGLLIPVMIDVMLEMGKGK